jgi:3-isopropylmalate/(R)-2-methylmalate dehydratase small subunit
MILHGRTWKYGDNIDTDVIIPARHTNTHDPVDLAGHCLEDLDPGFAANVQPGDIIVAGANFGCGSSREHAPLAIKGAGVGAVIAASFARIFFRNAFNMGLPILECPEAAADIQSGDVVAIDLASGLIKNPTRDQTYQAKPLPPFMRELVEAGGLMPFVLRELSREQGG